MVEIIVEYKDKKHSSATIKDGKIILRISNKIPTIDQKKHIESLSQKLIKKLKNKSQKNLTTNWQSGEHLSIYGIKHLFLDIETSDQTRLSIKFNESSPFLKIIKPKTLKNDEIKNKVISYITKKLHPMLYQYVEQINSETINQSIKNIKFKKLQSKWGYCNFKTKEIVLSTKLFSCSKFTFDYVIIHELCHLIEPNHKPQFWHLVEKYMPNYKEAQKELINFQ